MKRIVIVGGGFAGVSLARRLDGDKRFRVTLISASTDFEYHAALYRSATGRSPLEVSVPLNEIFAGTDITVVNDTIVKINDTKKIVTAASKKLYEYDDLILALGTVTAYFGITGLDEYSYNIKSIQGALELKSHLHTELTAGHRPDMNYVVVGAGPSGVELAGELATYLRQIRHNHKIKKNFHIDLVEATPRILPMLPERFSRVITKRLQDLGVKIYTSTAVKGETADALQLPEGNIDSHTVVWTAGMTNAPLFKDHPKLFTLGKGQRATVDEHLSAGKHIWVAGDSASSTKTGWAQTAIYDGHYLADLLKRRELNQSAAPYKPPNPVGAIPVGPNWCGVNLNGIQIFGYPGWVLRRWSDFKLYRQVLPMRLAVRSWIMGNRIEETCTPCKRG